MNAEVFPFRPLVDIDAVTYSIRPDSFFPGKYVIRSGFPFCYVTSEMGLEDARKVAGAMRQLGFTVTENI